MKILIVDDKEEDRYLLETMLKGSDYEVVSAANGAEALEKLHAIDCDMIISDILMPVMDGFQLCKECKRDEGLKDIPFIFYTATYTDEKDEELALKVGVDRFIRKPVEPDEFIKIIQGVIRDVEEGKIGWKRPTLAEEEEVFKLYSERLVKKLEEKTLDLEREVAERVRVEEVLRQSLARLRRTLEAAVSSLASAVEIRDPYIAGHQRRVAELACAIAEEMGLSQEQIDGLRMAALVHDIGKISVPAGILSKPGRLTEPEFEIIKVHPQVGYDILKGIEFPWPVAEIVLQHHERLDGSGYPQGLKGDEILLEARILGVADVVEAMSSHRPYRPAHSIDKALEEISQNRGVLYDPEVIDACLKLFTEKGFKFE
jgi:putative nucleotidyltransferase with HDIG domain